MDFGWLVLVVAVAVVWYVRGLVSMRAADVPGGCCRGQFYRRYWQHYRREREGLKRGRL